jgi:hypothetical protein
MFLPKLKRMGDGEIMLLFGGAFIVLLLGAAAAFRFFLR